MQKKKRIGGRILRLFLDSARTTGDHINIKKDLRYYRQKPICFAIFISNILVLLTMAPRNSRDVIEARRPHACSSPCALEEKEKNRKKTRNPAALETHHRKPHRPGNHDHLDDGVRRDTSHALVKPVLARFHGPRDCGNPPRKAVAINDNAKSRRQTRTQQQQTRLKKQCKPVRT